MEKVDFQELIWRKGKELYRDMPWRVNTEPYFVLVSEVMLQQTQVDRVIPKFHQFMMAFPTIQALAGAPLAEVLIVWSGLGYNRRAKFLHEAAKKVVTDFKGTIPDVYEDLVQLPGIGPNTAGAILAYSFNQPIVFVETNIRTVYFHHLFDTAGLISDKELREKVAETMDHEHPREWYWALMDYGAFLKKEGAGQIDRSKHYKKQASLKGSVREVRGLILKVLSTGDLTEKELAAHMPKDERFVKALTDLLAERLIKRTAGRLHLMR
jgi:A/G-specific adenine glycosylase